MSVSGKKSICWDCGVEFVLGPLALQMDRPKCADCSGLGEALEILQGNKAI